MPDDADVYRELAPLLRIRPELQAICRFGGQWTVPHAPEAQSWAPFHIVIHGECLLDAGDRTGVHLRTGDVALLPHGGHHTVRALTPASGAMAPLHVRRRLHDELLLKSNVEGEPDTRLICGRAAFEHARDNFVLAALPPLVVLRRERTRSFPRLQAITAAICDELEEDRLGAAAMAASLASSLMLLALREHLEGTEAPTGMLALLAGRQTARALAAMMNEPARAWTLDDLAGTAGASRATLVRLFQRAVSMAPLACLAALRLNIARHRLLATSAPLIVVAESVGYQSETAFSRAYSRRFGRPPAADRFAQHSAESGALTPQAAMRDESDPGG